MDFKRTLSTVALVALALPSFADLIVGSNLGTLGVGTYNQTGSTLGAANNASYYQPYTNPLANWDSEYVYQFTVTTPSMISLADNTDASIDFDYFLLDSLATGIDSGGKSYATTTGYTNFVDENDTFGIVGPGTYYLSVDTYRPPSLGSTPVTGGAFDFDLDIEAAPAAPAATPTQLGGSLDFALAANQVSWLSFDYTSGPLSLDTLGSSITDGGSNTDDTELGLYDSAGNLLATNDDIDFANGNYLSELSFNDGELLAGRYYLAVGAYDTEFNTGFDAVSSSDQAGTIHLNGLSPAAVPEPASMAALGLGLVAMLRRRRAR